MMEFLGLFFMFFVGILLCIWAVFSLSGAGIWVLNATLAAVLAVFAKAALNTAAKANELETRVAALEAAGRLESTPPAQPQDKNSAESAQPEPQKSAAQSAAESAQPQDKNSAEQAQQQPQKSAAQPSAEQGEDDET